MKYHDRGNPYHEFRVLRLVADGLHGDIHCHRAAKGGDEHELRFRHAPVVRRILRHVGQRLVAYCLVDGKNADKYKVNTEYDKAEP